MSRIIEVFCCDKKEDMRRVLTITKDTCDEIEYSMNSALELIQGNHGRIIDIDIRKYNGLYLGVITYTGSFLITRAFMEERDMESTVDKTVAKIDEFPF